MTKEEMEALATPPFATVDDLEDRYRELEGDERARAETLLEDASLIIMADLPRGWSANERTLRLLKPITCAVVQRKMSSRIASGAGEIPPASQVSLTTGQVTQQVSLANPFGNMKLTADERRLLGIGRQRIVQIDPLVGYGGGE